MPNASIQRISAVIHHPSADLLDVVTTLGYQCIVKRDQWKVGELCVFVEPDSVMPDAPWSAFYRAKSNRVKAIRLRNVWSFGVVESIGNVGYTGAAIEGLDISEDIGVTHYEPPQPQDLAASGPYGSGIPKTDQTRFQSIPDLPYGELVDVTLKIDGQSWSAFCKLPVEGVSELETGVGGRSFLYKLDCDNNYTRNERQYGVLAKLNAYCHAQGKSMCLRGESYGAGIQKGAHNPHASLPLGLALFSTWLMDERQYAHKGHPFYIHTVAGHLVWPVILRCQPFRSSRPMSS